MSGLECDKFVGIDKMNRNLYWFTEASYLTKLKINNRRTAVSYTHLNNALNRDAKKIAKAHNGFKNFDNKVAKCFGKK